MQHIRYLERTLYGKLGPVSLNFVNASQLAYHSFNSNKGRKHITSSQNYTFQEFCMNWIRRFA